MDNEKQSLQKRVWDNLSKINVNDKTEKKMNLTYLSWAWAWGVLMEHYPESYYTLHNDRLMNDGSVMVGVTLTIKDQEESFSRDMWLPVMNHNNSAIINPNAVAINKAYMRCLAKAIAMCGLGHYIYAGDDLPQEDDNNPPPKPKSPTNSKQSPPQNMSSTQGNQQKTPEQTLQGFIESVKVAEKKEDVEKYWKAVSKRLADYPELLSTANDHYEARKGDFELMEMN